MRRLFITRDAPRTRLGMEVESDPDALLLSLIPGSNSLPSFQVLAESAALAEGGVGVPRRDKAQTQGGVYETSKARLSRRIVAHEQALSVGSSDQEKLYRR